MFTKFSSGDFFAIFDFIPFPCLIASPKAIEKLNKPAADLGLKRGPVDEQLGAEISALIVHACDESKSMTINEHNLLLGSKERFFNIVVNPLKAPDGGAHAVVFLDEVTHLMETSNDLAVSLIETEVANRNLDRNISILSLMAKSGAELLRASTKEKALEILKNGISNAGLFDDVRIIERADELQGAVPREVVDAARNAFKRSMHARLVVPAPYIMIPITGRERIHGVVAARLRPEESGDLGIDLKPFAAMTAFTLDNIHLYKELMDSLRDLSLRNRAARVFQESHSIGELETRLSEVLAEQFSITWFRILREPSPAECPAEMREAVREAFQGSIREAAGEGGAGICVPISLHDPVTVDRSVYAVMALFSAGRTSIAEVEKEAMISLADLAAISLGTMRMHDDLRAHNVAVEYLNEELNKTIVELKAANEMKSRFVSTVSHEFRTPLTAISSYVQTLLAGLESIDPETTKSFLGVVRDETDRLTRLINQLLDLSRIQARDRPLASLPLSMKEIVGNVIKTLKSVAQSKQLDLVLVDGGPDGNVFGDEDALKQVILNLAGNAVRYTLPGGKVEIQVEEDHKFVYTAVRDTGIGIPRDSLDAIFGEFFTVSQTRAALARVENQRMNLSGELFGEGSGLGLSIAKAIIERHGGRISVSSNVGVGSEFIVTLMRRGGK